jgi:hypothetical protein
MSNSDSEKESDIYEMTEFSDYDSEEKEEEERDREDRDKSRLDRRDDGDTTYDDEYNQVPTFGQFQHMGELNELDIVSGFDLDPKNRRKMMANLTGEERFRKIANQYISENFKKIIRPTVISNLLENIKKIEYKNPKAFILAYYFISTGKKDDELPDTISDYIKNEEMGVDIKDVVRYVRLIRNIKK